MNYCIIPMTAAHPSRPTPLPRKPCMKTDALDTQKMVVVILAPPGG